MNAKISATSSLTGESIVDDEGFSSHEESSLYSSVRETEGENSSPCTTESFEDTSTVSVDESCSESASLSGLEPEVISSSSTSSLEQLIKQFLENQRQIRLKYSDILEEQISRLRQDFQPQFPPRKNFTDESIQTQAGDELSAVRRKLFDLYDTAQAQFNTKGVSASLVSLYNEIAEELNTSKLQEEHLNDLIMEKFEERDGTNDKKSAYSDLGKKYGVAVTKQGLRPVQESNQEKKYDAFIPKLTRKTNNHEREDKIDTQPPGIQLRERPKDSKHGDDIIPKRHSLYQRESHDSPDDVGSRRYSIKEPYPSVSESVQRGQGVDAPDLADRSLFSRQSNRMSKSDLHIPDKKHDSVSEADGFDPAYDWRTMPKHNAYKTETTNARRDEPSDKTDRDRDRKSYRFPEKSDGRSKGKSRSLVSDDSVESTTPSRPYKDRYALDVKPPTDSAGQRKKDQPSYLYQSYKKDLPKGFSFDHEHDSNKKYPLPLTRDEKRRYDDETRYPRTVKELPLAHYDRSIPKSVSLDDQDDYNEKSRLPVKIRADDKRYDDKDLNPGTAREPSLASDLFNSNKQQRKEEAVQDNRFPKFSRDKNTIPGQPVYKTMDQDIPDQQPRTSKQHRYQDGNPTMAKSDLNQTDLNKSHILDKVQGYNKFEQPRFSGKSLNKHPGTLMPNLTPEDYTAHDKDRLQMGAKDIRMKGNKVDDFFKIPPSLSGQQNEPAIQGPDSTTRHASDPRHMNTLVTKDRMDSGQSNDDPLIPFPVTDSSGTQNQTGRSYSPYQYDKSRERTNTSDMGPSRQPYQYDESPESPTTSGMDSQIFNTTTKSGPSHRPLHDDKSASSPSKPRIDSQRASTSPDSGPSHRPRQYDESPASPTKPEIDSRKASTSPDSGPSQRPRQYDESPVSPTQPGKDSRKASTSPDSGPSYRPRQYDESLLSPTKPGIDSRKASTSPDSGPSYRPRQYDESPVSPTKPGIGSRKTSTSPDIGPSYRPRQYDESTVSPTQPGKDSRKASTSPDSGPSHRPRQYDESPASPTKPEIDSRKASTSPDSGPSYRPRQYDESPVSPTKPGIGSRKTSTSPDSGPSYRPRQYDESLLSQTKPGIDSQKASFSPDSGPSLGPRQYNESPVNRTKLDMDYRKPSSPDSGPSYQPRQNDESPVSPTKPGIDSRRANTSPDSGPSYRPRQNDESSVSPAKPEIDNRKTSSTDSGPSYRPRQYDECPVSPTKPGIDSRRANTSPDSGPSYRPRQNDESSVSPSKPGIDSRKASMSPDSGPSYRPHQYDESPPASPTKPEIDSRKTSISPDSGPSYRPRQYDASSVSPSKPGIDSRKTSISPDSGPSLGPRQYDESPVSPSKPGIDSRKTSISPDSGPSLGPRQYDESRVSATKPEIDSRKASISPDSGPSYRPRQNDESSVSPSKPGINSRKAIMSPDRGPSYRPRQYDESPPASPTIPEIDSRKTSISPDSGPSYRPRQYDESSVSPSKAGIDSRKTSTSPDSGPSYRPRQYDESSVNPTKPGIHSRKASVSPDSGLSYRPRQYDESPASPTKPEIDSRKTSISPDSGPSYRPRQYEESSVSPSKPGKDSQKTSTSPDSGPSYRPRQYDESSVSPTKTGVDSRKASTSPDGGPSYRPRQYDECPVSPTKPGIDSRISSTSPDSGPSLGPRQYDESTVSPTKPGIDSRKASTSPGSGPSYRPLQHDESPMSPTKLGIDSRKASISPDGGPFLGQHQYDESPVSPTKPGIDSRKTNISPDSGPSYRPRQYDETPMSPTKPGIDSQKASTSPGSGPSYRPLQHDESPMSPTKLGIDSRKASISPDGGPFLGQHQYDESPVSPTKPGIDSRKASTSLDSGPSYRPRQYDESSVSPTKPGIDSRKTSTSPDSGPFLGPHQYDESPVSPTKPGIDSRKASTSLDSGHSYRPRQYDETPMSLTRPEIDYRKTSTSPDRGPSLGPRQHDESTVSPTKLGIDSRKASVSPDSGPSCRPRQYDESSVSPTKPGIDSRKVSTSPDSGPSYRPLEYDESPVSPTNAGIDSRNSSTSLDSGPSYRPRQYDESPVSPTKPGIDSRRIITSPESGSSQQPYLDDDSRGGPPSGINLQKVNDSLESGPSYQPLQYDESPVILTQSGVKSQRVNTSPDSGSQQPKLYDSQDYGQLKEPERRRLTNDNIQTLNRYSKELSNTDQLRNTGIRHKSKPQEDSPSEQYYDGAHDQRQNLLFGTSGHKPDAITKSDLKQLPKSTNLPQSTKHDTKLYQEQEDPKHNIYGKEMETKQPMSGAIMASRILAKLRNSRTNINQGKIEPTSRLNSPEYEMDADQSDLGVSTDEAVSVDIRDPRQTPDTTKQFVGSNTARDVENIGKGKYEKQQPGNIVAKREGRISEGYVGKTDQPPDDSEQELDVILPTESRPTDIDDNDADHDSKPKKKLLMDEIAGTLRMLNQLKKRRDRMKQKEKFIIEQEQLQSEKLEDIMPYPERTVSSKVEKEATQNLAETEKSSENIESTSDLTKQKRDIDTEMSPEDMMKLSRILAKIQKDRAKAKPDYVSKENDEKSSQNDVMMASNLLAKLKKVQAQKKRDKSRNREQKTHQVQSSSYEKHNESKKDLENVSRLVSKTDDEDDDTKNIQPSQNDVIMASRILAHTKRGGPLKDELENKQAANIKREKKSMPLKKGVINGSPLVSETTHDQANGQLNVPSSDYQQQDSQSEAESFERPDNLTASRILKQYMNKSDKNYKKKTIPMASAQQKQEQRVSKHDGIPSTNERLESNKVKQYEFWETSRDQPGSDSSYDSNEDLSFTEMDKKLYTKSSPKKSIADELDQYFTAHPDSPRLSDTLLVLPKTPGMERPVEYRHTPGLEWFVDGENELIEGDRGHKAMAYYDGRHDAVGHTGWDKPIGRHDTVTNVHTDISAGTGALRNADKEKVFSSRRRRENTIVQMNDSFTTVSMKPSVTMSSSDSLICVRSFVENVERGHLNLRENIRYGNAGGGFSEKRIVRGADICRYCCSFKFWLYILILSFVVILCLIRRTNDCGHHSDYSFMDDLSTLIHLHNLRPPPCFIDA